MSKSNGKRPGITNPQAKFLASLSKQLGRRYEGRGMSKASAARMIDRYLRDLGREPKSRGNVGVVAVDEQVDDIRTESYFNG